MRKANIFHTKGFKKAIDHAAAESNRLQKEYYDKNKSSKSEDKQAEKVVYDLPMSTCDNTNFPIYIKKIDKLVDDAFKIYGPALKKLGQPVKNELREEIIEIFTEVKADKLRKDYGDFYDILADQILKAVYKRLRKRINSQAVCEYNKVKLDKSYISIKNILNILKEELGGGE